MKSDRRVDELVGSAIAAGIVPASATAPAGADRPWPVVLLTAFGAWLAAIPLAAVAAMLLADVLKKESGALIAGALLLGVAIAVLRRRDVPLFAEQLLVPALIVGAALTGWDLFRDLPPVAACTALAILATAIAFAIPRPWLRALLGAAAATLVALAWVPWHGQWSGAGIAVFWLAWHCNLLLWTIAAVAPRAVGVDGHSARAAAALDSLAAGWLLATVAGLAWWSGRTFLVGAAISAGPMGELLSGGSGHALQSGSASSLLRTGSIVLALAAAGWAARRWPGSRNPASAGVALVLVALAALMPALGGALLALSVCATTKRPRLAATAALTAAWIVGGFYYQLAWPLAIKGGVLVGAGGVLGALALAALSAQPAPPAATGAASPRRGGARPIAIEHLGIVATAVLVVLVGNVAIWQKQMLIAHGEPVFVELAPVDPRSLMQGDYMRLSFRIPGQLLEDSGGLLARERPRIVGRRDARGVLTLLRRDRGEPLAADELRIELTPRHGDWVLVSDAWSFREGEAQRWAAARYGEFRVAPSGQALLVGLRGARLEEL